MTPDKMSNAELSDWLNARWNIHGNGHEEEAIKRLRAMPELSTAPTDKRGIIREWISDIVVLSVIIAMVYFVVGLG